MWSIPSKRSCWKFSVRPEACRKRRKLTMEQAAQRAGMDRGTLRQVERGNPSISLGAYLNVMGVYELQEDIRLLAAADELGRKLQDLELLTTK
jgi:transcriptional regulator with XRE-family HTH domain